MNKILKNKSEIMHYLEVGEFLLDNLIENYNLPCFKLGNRWMSNAEAIDKWAFELSMGNVIIPENNKV